MAVPFSNTKLRVPKGFQNILEGIAREVLRSQPDNIFEFGAKYFEQCLRVRDETGHDPAVHGAKLEDRFYNNDSFSSPSVDPSDPRQQDAALSIQTEFRRHSAKKEVDAMKEEEAATKIQAGFRGYQDRQKVLEMKEPEEVSKHQEDSERLKGGEDEVDIDLNDPEVADAALKIQAGFRGHKARQEMKSVKEPETEEDQSKSQESKGNEEVDIDLNDPDVANAATKIQAGFRGHKTRQELKEKLKESETSPPEEKQDEIDIDLDDPEVSKAATKIQAGFRGHKTRQEMKAQKEQQTNEPPSEKEEAKGDNKEETKGDNKEEEIDIDLNDPDVEKAATKIQAGFKGYKTRKEMKGKTEEEETETAPSSEQEGVTKPDEEEEVDIDLNDPEVEKAAVKIQASFKGFQARKEIKMQQEAEGEKQETAPPTETTEDKGEEIDIDLEDPETAKAALKIQAGFRGYQTRKELQSTKSETTEGQGESETKDEAVEQTDSKGETETKEEAAGEGETQGETTEEQGEAKTEDAPSDEKQ